ncbi:MAG: hypothetical protein GY725_19195 [bacterium]|nr:hypothetical protein [bacterium]
MNSLPIRRLLALAPFLALSFLSAPSVHGQCTGNCTNIPGGAVTGVWVPGVYCVTGNITVNGLTILPGVCVRIDPGVTITVQTTISAIGTEASPIYFTSNQPAGWGGILFQNTPPGSVFEYCRIEGADASALNIVDSTPAIRHCEIVNNTAVSGNGAGINASLTAGLTLRIEDTLIDGNAVNPAQAISTNRFGGGVFVSGDCELLRCTITNNTVFARWQGCSNTATGRGGGVRVENGTYSVENCLIADNHVTALSVVVAGCGHVSATAQALGGGFYLGSGTLLMSNSILGGNTVSASAQAGIPITVPNGSGIHVAGGTATLENCTIARGNREGARRTGGSLTIRNSIVFDNGSDELAGTVTAEYSCIQGSPIYPGPGNINFNPAFEGTGTGICDLTIVPSSPCVDAGTGSGDVCIPPSHGLASTDIGAHGGPGACNWGGQVGTNYCGPAVNNSTGQPGTILAWSPTMARLECLILVADQLPAGQFGYFLASMTQGMFCPPSSSGCICLAIPIARFNSQIILGPTGRAQVDLRSIPISPSPVAVMAGQTWNFQCWYRDTGNTNNFTDGVSVSF